MNPLALMNFGLAPVPTYRPTTPRNVTREREKRTRDMRRADIVETIGSRGPMTAAQIRDEMVIDTDRMTETDIAALVRDGRLIACAIAGEAHYVCPLEEMAA